MLPSATVYPDAVQYVIAVGLEEYLHTIRRHPRQKAAAAESDSSTRLRHWMC